jgi:hypothetical protein
VLPLGRWYQCQLEWLLTVGCPRLSLSHSNRTIHIPAIMIGLHHYDHVHTNPSVQRTSQSLSCVGSPSKWDISSQILRFPGFCPFPLISAGCSRLDVGRASSDHNHWQWFNVHQLKMKNARFLMLPMRRGKLRPLFSFFFFLTDAPLPPLPRHATFPFSRTRTHSEVTKWLCGRLCVVDERYKWIRPIELR